MLCQANFDNMGVERRGFDSFNSYKNKKYNLAKGEVLISLTFKNKKYNLAGRSIKCSTIL
ncbi:hypothetical protein AGMMS49593_03770 [Endomicrobiia bacterium]|nr:hypothetical protein AGMMS49593_03770 [Endomicrobiia bacterium]